MAYSYLTVFNKAPKTKVKILGFDALTGSFTPGNPIYQTVNGVLVASAIVDSVHVDGTAGEVYLSNDWGTFQDNEIIYESALGSELVTNGGFDTDTVWGKNPGVTITGGECVFTNVVFTDGVWQNSTVTVGNYYVTTFDITEYTEGQLTIIGGGGAAESVDSYSWVFTADQPYFKLGSLKNPGVTTSKIDNVSVKQITNAALANGTLREIYLEGWKNF